MRYTGKIIVLAFPDTYVKMSTEFICKVLPLLGLGTKHYIKAGHAALVLIHNKTGEAFYYDFGRYVTPPAQGRVRGKNTDAELEIPFKAIIDAKNELENLDDFLLWLDAHPQKTHGSGRLLASVCDDIDFNKANTYIKNIQNRGSIPYGVFEKEGSNCSRFVTDTILAATNNTKITRRLKFNKLFTPSTVGNVEKAATKRIVFQVYNGIVQQFTGTALKENLTNYFDKKNVPSIHTVAQENPKVLIPSHWHTLNGTGSTSYFEILNEPSLPEDHFRIKRYNDLLQQDFDGVYTASNFNVQEAYRFTYDSHCAFCHVIQNNQKIKLSVVASYSEFSSLRKEHSA